MCNCGCNTCETKIRGPLLTEGKVKSLLSEGLQYHIDKKIPLFETVYRIGSDKHLALIKEARKMYSRNIIDLCEDDEALIKTHLGEFALYEGESVPLDLPMLDETNKISDDKLGRLIPKLPKGYVGKNTGIGEYTISTPDGEDIVLTQSKDKKNWVYEPSNVALKILNESDSNYPDFDLNKNIKYQEGSISSGMWRYTGQEQGGKGVYRNLNNGQILAFDRSDFDIFKNNLSSHFDFSESLNEATVDYNFSKEELIRVIKQLKRGASTEIGMIKAFEKALGRELTDDEIRGFKLNEAELDEAEFRGKDVPLNKPKRGGSKAYYVYVRDPKTKKVKKVSFGSGGLRAKIKNKEARNAFAARHNCKNKKDRTKAGYWSCNLPRYAKALGLGANMNTFW